MLTTSSVVAGTVQVFSTSVRCAVVTASVLTLVDTVETVVFPLVVFLLPSLYVTVVTGVVFVVVTVVTTVVVVVVSV